MLRCQLCVSDNDCCAIDGHASRTVGTSGHTTCCRSCCKCGVGNGKRNWLGRSRCVRAQNALVHLVSVGFWICVGFLAWVERGEELPLCKTGVPYTGMGGGSRRLCKCQQNQLQCIWYAAHIKAICPARDANEKGKVGRSKRVSWFRRLVEGGWRNMAACEFLLRY